MVLKKSILLVAAVAVAGVMGNLSSVLQNIGNKLKVPLIFNGYNVSIQSVPYQVHLRILVGSSYHKCGGSIISYDSVLTAAHCLSGASEVTIRTGSTFSNKGGITYTSTTFVVHPKYKSYDYDYDVAIIKVVGGILTSHKANLVYLADKDEEVPVDTEIFVAGWGLTGWIREPLERSKYWRGLFSAVDCVKLEENRTSEVLKIAKVPVILNSDCKERYHSEGIDITSNMFCAGHPEGGQDACGGDSGSPAVMEDENDFAVQIGITATGIECGTAEYPGVYIKVSAPEIRDFIQKYAGV